MKINKNIQISLLIFSTTVLITVILTLLLSNLVRHEFLGMDNGYYSLTVYSEGSNEVTLSLLNKHLDNSKDIIIVVHNINSNAVYVYDKGLNYGTKLASGNYFEVSDFDNNENVCLIDESSINSNLIDDNQVYIHGRWYDIIGTIDSNHPLSFNYDSAYQKYEAYPIVLPISAISSIQGYVYLYNADELTAKEIANIVANGQEFYSFKYNSTVNMIQDLIMHPTFRNIVLGFLLSIVILVVAYYMILLKRASEFSVYFLYGASKKDLIKILCKDYAFLVVVISFIGCNCALLINNIRIKYALVLLIVYAISLLINVLIFAISFLIFKSKNVLLGGLK